MFAGNASLTKNAAKSHCCHAYPRHLTNASDTTSSAQNAGHVHFMLSSGQQMLTMDSMLASLTMTSAMGTYA